MVFFFAFFQSFNLLNYQQDAIIFLAPISAFDQVLAEEPTVNRLVFGSAFSGLNNSSVLKLLLRPIRTNYGHP
jgi:hypothetical protein